MKRGLYISLGVLCVALGAVGVVLPGLPTTPFLLAASWLFYRSSPRLQEWLLGSSLGIYIRNYHKRGGMTRRTKVMVVLLMATMVGCSIHFFIASPTVDYIVAGAGIVGCLVVIFKVPNAKSDTEQREIDALQGRESDNSAL